MISRKSGLRFERELISSAKHQGIYAFKIPVVKHEGWMLDGAYDIAMLSGGVYIGVECKAMSTRTSFSFTRVAPQQIAALLAVHKGGGRGLVAINIRIPRHQEMLVMSVVDFLHRQEISKRKSLSVAELATIPILNKAGGYWDVKEIFTLPYP